MKKSGKFLALFLVFILAFSADGSPAAAAAVKPALDGKGTKSNPWKITDEKGLFEFYDYLDKSGDSDPGEYFKITADITVTKDLPEDPESFEGILDGGGHTIYNLRPGLFWQNKGTVKNLSIVLKEGYVCNAWYCGGLAYSNTQEAVIENCHVTGTIYNTFQRKNDLAATGLLVGANFEGYRTTKSGSITGCTAEGTVVAPAGSNAGGIAGKAEGIIKDCRDGATLDLKETTEEIVDAAKKAAEKAASKKENDISDQKRSDQKADKKTDKKKVGESQGSVTLTGNNLFAGNVSDYPFAGVYYYDNLTLSAGANILSDRISQLVLVVNGTLTIGEGASIRVRNGYYPDQPYIMIEHMTSDALQAYGEDMGLFRLYPNTYGKGGDGGDGTPGFSGTYSTGYGGSGGAGGYGGGEGGKGAYSDSVSGGYGFNNGGDGGSCSGNYAKGGNADSVGYHASCQPYGGNGGNGGGGNGGNGSAGMGNSNILYGGGGGGGGGYGGGILTIVADKIVVNSSEPVFLVSGQTGGKGYGLYPYKGHNGADGDGGMLIIASPDYEKDKAHWNAGTQKPDSFVALYSRQNKEGGYAQKNVLPGGHGIVTGGPDKVYIGKMADASSKSSMDKEEAMQLLMNWQYMNRTAEEESASGNSSGGNRPGGSSGGLAPDGKPNCIICGNTGRRPCTLCHETGKVTTGNFSIGGGISGSSLGFTDGGIFETSCGNCGGDGWLPCSCGR